MSIFERTRKDFEQMTLSYTTKVELTTIEKKIVMRF